MVFCINKLSLYCLCCCGSILVFNVCSLGQKVFMSRVLDFVWWPNFNLDSLQLLQLFLCIGFWFYPLHILIESQQYSPFFLGESVGFALDFGCKIGPPCAHEPYKKRIEVQTLAELVFQQKVIYQRSIHFSVSVPVFSTLEDAVCTYPVVVHVFQ